MTTKPFQMDTAVNEKCIYVSSVTMVAV